MCRFTKNTKPSISGGFFMRRIQMAKNETYEQFTEKFKPKKTTDDCYTPPRVYDTVLSWAVEEYRLQGREVVRPFYPGGDYENFEYPDGCVVVDNPPFSILTKIIDFYQEQGISFFLFAPTLTLFSATGIREGVCALVVGSPVVYENGAKVDTSFVTNLDEYKFRVEPNLYRRIKETQDIDALQMPKYDFPAGVVSAARIRPLAKAGIDFRVKPNECHFIRGLDHQREHKKSIYGGGFLLSSQKAAEQKIAEQKTKTKAIYFPLSEREQEIVRRLSDGYS